MEGVEEGTKANEATVREGPGLVGTGLGPWVEEHHPCAVYDICLHPAYVQHLLYLPCSNHVMVRRPPNLNSAVVLVVVREAERTERAIDAIETVHVTLALVRIAVCLALHEELGSE